TKPNNTDFFGEKLAKIRQILPEIFSEQTLDLDKLKALLGEHIAQNERYCLTWAGKTQAYQTLQAPTQNTLAPCPSESVDFDTTQNIFIESDNLEALKILQKSYAGKIKMIYIDPPYNTGNDFIYHDDFRQSKKDYDIATGDRDINGQLLKSFKKNSKDNGYYHSNWLSMMLPRLHLARTLLADDGVIFISIDDNEQAQLKLLCDEIFGGENFVGKIGWESKTKSQNTKTAYNKLQPKIEYILVYAKKEKMRFNLIEIGKKEYLLQDEKGNYRLFKQEPMSANGIRGRETMIYPILGIYPPEGKQWQIGKEMADEFESRNDIIIENGSIIFKMRPDDERNEITEPFWAFIDKTIGTAESAKGELGQIIKNHGFETVKPVDLIKKLIIHASNNNDVILDFFAGSATTAHAVMQLNSEDNGNRQFIMVQLPELTDEKSEAYKAGFKTISDISKERIRRAGVKIKQQNPDKKLDTGFKVFKLSQSNFKAWQIDDDDISKQLEMYIDPLKDNANELDVVYELLLKMGLKLTADIKFDNGVYWLNCDNKLYAIVLNLLSQDDFNAIIAKKPSKTVVLDKAFLNDSQKSNVILQFKDAGLYFESI
ncbi:MAG: site-specific DNA-methyltransferase, partial [Moraxella sp.]|nr:site-specific DNA-methyltransferase [Moraxella sp.]